MVSLASFTYSFTAVSDTPISGLNFGNVCVGAGGGHTLGYWSNKNGTAAASSFWAATLNGLPLVNGTGTDVTPFANYAAFRSWLLSASATNMAYMLSAQLAAMKLNVASGNTSASAMVYAPSVTGASSTGFISISDLMALAVAQLTAHPNTTSAADPTNRAIQGALKTALDRANNNLNFLQGGPTSCPTPVFP